MNNLIKQCNSGWNWDLLLLNWSPVSPVFTMRFLDEDFVEIWKISDALCPNWPVYTAHLSDRWCRYKLISCSCLALWFVSANNRMSASHTVSRLELKLRRTSLLCCNFPCNRFVSVQTGLTRESDKWGMTAADLFPNKSHATANVSLLACLQKLHSTTTLKGYFSSFFTLINVGVDKYACFMQMHVSYYCNKPKQWQILFSIYLPI